VIDPSGAQTAVLREFRSEYGRAVAVLLRTLGDLDAAEDAVQDAFAAAAATWPSRGVPPNPQAWIIATARHRAVDRWRRADTAHRHLPDLARPVAVDPPSGELDDELRLMFLCAHPSLSPPSQVALTLRFVAGLTAAEIGRAFGAPETTIAQRLSRAKAKVRGAGIGMRLPEPERWRDRLDTVLAVVYAVYNEGYLASAGPLTRGELTREGVRLARHLAAMAPGDGEVKGLLALLLLLQAREPARATADGRLVPLPEQDRTRWDQALIEEGHRLVRDCLAAGRPGPYQIQAAIQAVHCQAARDEDTDWAQILALYDHLLVFLPTAAARVGRTVAVGKVHGPAAGLDALDALGEAAADQYGLAVRADLLQSLGRHDEARAAFLRAAGLAGNDAERRLLQDRASRATSG
jgi:RNA polymerase sigma-70 factor (ECF subfamily)